MRTQSKSNSLIVYSIVGLSILWFTSTYWYFGFDESSTRLNIRWSARFSIVCFCMAFAASSFHALYSNLVSRWLIDQRRNLGVSFALIHLIHLLFLVILHQYFHPLFHIRSVVELALGGLAYLFLVLMLLTSFDIFKKHLSSAAWSRLHTIGGFWILIVFSNSILGRVFGGTLEYLPLGILVVSVWVFRLLAWRKKSSSALGRSDT